jgi:signal transduction histidine kinase
MLRDATGVHQAVALTPAERFASGRPGIAPDEQRIFERFYRVGASGSARSGLGLAIVRGLEESHGGRVWLDSIPGCGTRFRIALRQPIAEAPRHLSPGLPP